MKNLDEVRDSKAIERYPTENNTITSVNDFLRIGYKNGFDEAVKLKDEELRKVVEPLEKNLYSALRYLYWREDDLIGDDLKGDGKLTANYKNMISELEKALEDYEKKVKDEK